MPPTIPAAADVFGMDSHSKTDGAERGDLGELVRSAGHGAMRPARER